MNEENFSVNPVNFSNIKSTDPLRPSGVGSQKKNLVIIIVLALVLLLVLGVFLFWIMSSNKKTAGQLSEEAISAGFGSQLLEKAQNPIKDKLPETNPFQEDTNPLKDVYQNPF